MLNVDLFGLVAREGEIDVGELFGGQMILPFELVEKIVGEVAVAEKQPAFAGGSGFGTLFHEAAIGRDAGPRANHDDGAGGVFGQTEMAVGLDVDARGVADFAAVGEVRGRDALAIVAVARPAHGSDEEVRFALMRTQAGGDRIKTPRQRTEKAQELVGLELFLVLGEQVQQLAVGRVFRERVALGELGDIGAACHLGKS